MSFSKFIETYLQPGDVVMVHSSYKHLWAHFNRIAPAEIISTLKEAVTKSGGLFFPTFTYNYVRLNQVTPPFDPETTRSLTGSLTEYMRQSDGVRRTNSPTHSFAVWGSPLKDIMNFDNPDDPTGPDSPCGYVADHPKGKLLLLGTGFETLTFVHYLESYFKVPWLHHNCWTHLGVEPAGISVTGIRKLTVLPGCSKGFVHLENELAQTAQLQSFSDTPMKGYSILPGDLLRVAKEFVTLTPWKLLCDDSACKPCNFRRTLFHATY